MASIQRAVGRGVTNPRSEDVLLVQQLLNRHRPAPLSKIAEDGIQGNETIGAIEEFQRRVVKMNPPDGRVDPNGRTIRMLSQTPGQGGVEPSALTHHRIVAASPVGAAGPKTTTTPPAVVGQFDTFSHPDASKVTLSYGSNAVRLNAKAEHLLKSILASVGIVGATVTSTLRTYHDQARITMTQTYVSNPNTVAQWYGQDVLDACKRFSKTNDIQGFADWWRDRDAKRGRVSSRHLSNRALDVVPNGNRAKFAKKVEELIPVAGSGVQRIIPKGVMGEPVDHVEFTFPVTDRSS